MSDIIKVKDQDADVVDFVMDGKETITEEEYNKKYKTKDKEVENESDDNEETVS